MQFQFSERKETPPSTFQVEREAKKFALHMTVWVTLIPGKKSFKCWYICAGRSITQCTLRIGKAYPIRKHPGSSLF